MLQVVADAEAGRKGAQKALPYAIALAAALDAESPFIRPDSLVVSLILYLSKLVLPCIWEPRWWEDCSQNQACQDDWSEVLCSYCGRWTVTACASQS